MKIPTLAFEKLQKYRVDQKKQPPILNQLSYFNVQLEVKFTVHSDA